MNTCSIDTRASNVLVSMNKDKLTFNTDRTIFTGGTISSVTAGLTVLEKTALFKTSPLRERQSV